MDYKKKYKEALERAKIVNPGTNDYNIVTSIFPELKESEDEILRKWLIKYFDKVNDVVEVDRKKIIAWLEKQGLLNNDKYQTVPVEILDRLYKSEKELEELKQGEQKPVISEYALREGIVHFGITQYQIDNWLKKYVYVEKQGKQKPTDKVEPEFKIEKGKWYVCDTPRYADFVVGKAYFCPKNEMLKPYENGMALYVAKHYFHLWTIQDAKDGDVLACENGWTCIFKALDSHTNTFSSYCFMDKDKWFCNTGSECHTLDKAFIKAYNGEIHPATKKQRDFLFQKMKEVGYEWDVEKKELKDIVKEQNSTEDNCKISDWDIKVDTIEYNNGYECGKQRVLKYPEDYGLYRKPACSEEHISIIEKDGEQWVRICALGEDFIIAAHDYKDGDNTKFNWVEACSIGTFSEKQGHIMFALLDEINDRLEEIGGEPLDSLYWSSTDYSSYYAWLMLFSSGSVDINGKYNSHAVRRVIAF